MNPCLRRLERAVTGVTLIALAPLFALKRIAAFLDTLSRPIEYVHPTRLSARWQTQMPSWPSPIDDSHRCDDLPSGLY
jgi:hypothetical protein